MWPAVRTKNQSSKINALYKGFYELESRLNLDSEYAAELRFDSDSKAQEKWEKWEKRQIRI